MKKIIKYLKDFFRSDFSVGYYLTVTLILVGGYVINYGYHFKKLQLDAYYGSTEQFFRFLLFFSSVYFLILLVQAAWKRDFSPFKNKSYLLKISVALVILSFDSSSRHIYQWLATTFDISWELRRWFFYLFTSLHQFVNLGILMFILKYIFDRYEDSVYGLTLKNFDVKPYFIMLLFMLPLIAWASFQGDFLRNYPIYKDNFDIVAQRLEPWKAVAGFELSYAFRFVGVELFFRGFLIIGMLKLIGERAVMPMVVLYSFWHFGKPLPESIGAAFGGYILAVIAMRTRSVFGGIIVHIGVAMMMEAGAYLNLYVF
jgi:hypothetical protein